MLTCSLFDPYRKEITHGFFLENIRHSFKVIQQIFPELDLCEVHQTHSDQTIKINNYLKLETADAMISSTPNIGLVIKIADCQDLMIYNPLTKEIANIHAGWRGLINKIIPKTIHQMQGNPSDMLVGISPSLGPCCAEFSDPINELGPEYKKYFLSNNHVDLWAIAEDQLQSTGITQIERLRYCTKCSTSPEDIPFSSYRRGHKTRMGDLIALRRN